MDQMLSKNSLSTSELVERRKRISKAEFYANFAEGAGKPVVITDAMEEWMARTKWTFDFFRSEYGDDIVHTAEKFYGPELVLEIKLREFIDYIESPDSSSLKKLANGAPLYLYTYKPFSRHPELLHDYDAPYFVDDLFEYLPPLLKKIYNQGWILIGPKGTLSHLHVDFWHTQGWLAQMRGRKHCVLFSPKDTPYLYKGEVDPLRPDFEKFPLFREAKPFEAILEPGELLFIPSGWWHHVLALEKSITLTHSIFNHSNLGPFLEDVIRDLPELLRRFNSPQFCKALKVEWRCKGFVLPGFQQEDLDHVAEGRTR